MDRIAIVPAAPEALELEVARLWHGGPPPRPELRAALRLAAEPRALRIEARMPHQRPARIPSAPPGERVDRLWEYDVVECFLVAADGRYLEVELGAGGHYLALRFSAPREREQTFSGERLRVDWRAEAGGWKAGCTLPRCWVPEPVVALNGFAIGGGHHLAHAPTGGPRPDFHRPDGFPAARIPSWE